MYHFNKDEREVKTIINEFISRHIIPKAKERNLKKEHPTKILNELNLRKISAICINKEYGGLGFECMSNMIVLNELGKADPSIAHIFAINSLGFNYALQNFGNEYIKETFLKNCTLNGKNGILAGVESESEIRTTAIKDGDYFILNGAKAMVSEALYGDYAIVWAKTSYSENMFEGTTLFIVDLKNTVGVEISDKKETTGLSSLSVSEILFNDVKVSKLNILGDLNNGMTILSQIMIMMKLGVSAITLGIAERIYEETITYTKLRKLNNKPLFEGENYKFMLVDIYSKIDMLHTYLFYEVKNIFKVNPIVSSSSVKYLMVTESMKIVDICYKMFGGEIYFKGHIVEQFYLDIHAFLTLGGSHGLMQSIISKSIYK